MGPLQFMVISFEGNRFTGEIMPELNALRERDLIRILDLVFVSRDRCGEVTSMELTDLSPGDATAFSALDAATGDWFAEGDVAQIGDSLPYESSVALVLFEHRWARSLDAVTRRANGVLLAEGMVPREIVEEVEARLADRV